MKDVLKLLSIILAAAVFMFILLYYLMNYDKAPPYKAGKYYAMEWVYDTMYFRVERHEKGYTTYTNLEDKFTFTSYRFGRGGLLGEYNPNTKKITKTGSIKEFATEFYNPLLTHK